MQTTYKRIRTNNKPDVSKSYIQMYYEHQYDRINKLEEQRLALTNIVITVSIVAFTFGFDNQIINLTPITGIGIPVLIILFNIFAIIFINNCDIFIDLHQKRASRILELFAYDLNEINKSLPWPKLSILSDRKAIQVIIHILVIVGALVQFIFYIRNI